MYSLKELFEVNTSWILPSGEVMTVPFEDHDNNLPDFCQTVEQAEKCCVRVACSWGFSAPISEIYLPERLTVQQAQRLIEIEESCQKYINEPHIGSIIDKVDKFGNYSWKEILEIA
ncbi:MAG TPA: hypothetical protein VK172_10200 [Lentimicrobium sp.]|nr:hypothetical protein [Lentimicrobium sp.]